MKEPWEVFYDELWQEIERTWARQPDGKIQLTEAESDSIWHTASAATAWHLVDSLHWNPPHAEELVMRFRAAYGDRTAGQTPREALRNTWTEWNLRRH